MPDGESTWPAGFPEVVEPRPAVPFGSRSFAFSRIEGIGRGTRLASA